VVQDVPEVQRIERAEAEVDAELEAGLSGRGIDPVVLLEEQDAETMKPGVLDGKPVFGFIHAEPAGAARSSRKENVIVDNLLAGLSGCLESLEVLDEVAGHEISRVALSVVAELLPELEPCDVRR